MTILPGCANKTNWNVSLRKDDKNPYGTYLAYHSLQSFFPGAKMETISRWSRYDDIAEKDHRGNTSLLIMEGLDLYLSDIEVNSLIAYADMGNEVFIFASNLDGKLEKELGYSKVPGSSVCYEEIPLTEHNDGTDNKGALSLSNNKEPFGYYGRYIKGYFIKNTDSNHIAYNTVAKKGGIALYPDILGKTGSGPDIIRFKVGNGHITLHAAPLVLSNYFLLQPGNQKYIDALWNTLPAGITRVYWNEYYKHSADHSDFGVLWRYPATRNALLLAIIALILYILFEGKRRQRILPVITPLENSSVSFAETVGRLYYNKGDHSNLAEKMIQHFLEWVRNRYYLNTNYLNDLFIQQLSAKSGQKENMVRNLVEMIHEIRNGYKADEAYLYQLYNSIEQFYKSKPDGTY